MRRSEAYQVKTGDNLADPDFWNRRFEDLDLRLHAREQDATALADAVGVFQALALSRINDTLTPVLQDAIHRLSTVGALFEADSSTPTTPGEGRKVFTVLAAQRGGYVPTSYVAIVSVGTPSAAMSAQVVGYDRNSGALTVEVLSAAGAGEHSDWKIRLAAPPDTDHAGRTDNPHMTTAAQVGAYTSAQVNAALSSLSATLTAQLNAAIGAVIGNAGPDANTLAKLADSRLRFDAAQPLDDAAKVRARANLGLGALAVMGESALRSLLDVAVYSASQTVTIPTGAARALVLLWGGSSGGAGSPGSGAGAALKWLSAVTPGATLSLTIGSAGGGGGRPGGTSTLSSGSQAIGTLTACGGSYGAGGAALGGDVNAPGSSAYGGLSGFGVSCGGAAEQAGMDGGCIIFWCR
jgi:hypothetical protein